MSRFAYLRAVVAQFLRDRLPSKEQVVDALKRSTVTFLIVFGVQVSAGIAEVHTVQTAWALAVSAATFAANVVFRTVIKPAVATIEFVPVWPPAIPPTD